MNLFRTLVKSRKNLGNIRDRVVYPFEKQGVGDSSDKLPYETCAGVKSWFNDIARMVCV